MSASKVGDGNTVTSPPFRDWVWWLRHRCGGDSAGELGIGMAKLGMLGWWWNGGEIRSKGTGTGIEHSGLNVANRGSALFAVGGRPFDLAA